MKDNKWAIVALKMWFIVVENDFAAWPDIIHSDTFLDKAVSVLAQHNELN